MASNAWWKWWAGWRVADALVLVSFVLLFVTGTAGLLLVGGGRPVAPLAGVWLLIVGSCALFFGLLWHFATKVVGGVGPGAYGFRTAAVLLSLLVAGAAAPEAIRDVLRTGESAAQLALVTTPRLAVAISPRGGAEGLTGREAARELLDCFAADWPLRRGDIEPGAEPDAEDIARAGGFCRPAAIGWEARAGDWFLFLAFLLLTLIVARNLLEAYRRQYFPITAAGDPLPPGQAPDPRQKPVISYGAWLALLVYTAILTPATYLAIGSLVLLQTEAPQPPPTLEQALAAATPSSSDPLVLALGETATADGRAASFRALTIQRAAELDEAFARELYNARAALTPPQFGYRVAYLKEWRAIHRARLGQELRQCALPRRDGTLIASIGAPAGLPAAAAAAPATTPNPYLAPAAPVAAASASGGTPDAAVADAEPGPAPETGATVLAYGARAPALMPCVEPAGSTVPPVSIEERQGLVDRLYPWLGADRSSRPVLLMMGLLGFGLFGAAVRAMAREEQIVFEEKSEGAKLNAAQFGSIIVHGAGAAMAVFLAFQAGALVFTGGTNGSPFPQLLFVFLGAVFAEEVWGWGRTALQGVLGRVRGAAGRLQGDKETAHARARADLKAARKRLTLLDPTARTAEEARLTELERTLEARQREAEAALADANSAWSQVSTTPSDEASQVWTGKFKRAEEAVRAFMESAEAVSRTAAATAQS